MNFTVDLNAEGPLFSPRKPPGDRQEGPGGRLKMNFTVDLNAEGPLFSPRKPLKGTRKLQKMATVS